MKVPLKDRPTAVYHHMNANGDTLYIGCSHDPALRFGGHCSTAAWAREVVNIRCDWYSTRTEALAAELVAIKRFDPPHNGKPGYNPRKARTNNGHKFVEAWLAASPLSLADFAKAIDRPLAYARKLSSAWCRPRFSVQIDICIASGGLVPTHVWDSMEPVAFYEVPPSEALQSLHEASAMLARWADEDRTRAAA